MKNGKVKKKLNKKSLMLVITISLVALIALVPISYAVFTGYAFAQRTIGAYEQYGDVFTSNFLRTGYLQDNINLVYTTSVEERASTYVTICNYPQGNPTTFSRVPIEYSLTAKWVYYDNGSYVQANATYLSEYSGYSVIIGETTFATSSTSISLGTSTLTANEASTDSYRISFNTLFSTSTPPNLYLSVTATPTDANFHTLVGVFKPTLRPLGASNNWTCSFRDDTSNSPISYDGFNYLVTGVGHGTMSISWDNTKVALSFVSQKMIGATIVTNGSTSTISFSVDSDIESRYELQFYKVDVTGSKWYSDNGLIYLQDEEDNNIVNFTFSE